MNKQATNKASETNIKEAFVEKPKNRWQWLVGLGPLSIGILGWYKYYQYQKKN